MSKYKVIHHKENNEIEEYEIEAADLSDAQQIVLDQENIKISLEQAIDYSIYYQRGKRYAGIKVGNSNLSFQNYGCFTCALAFIAGLDPLVAMKKMIDGGAYSGALILSQKAADILGLELLNGDDKYIAGKMNDINYMPKFQTIKEVLLGKSQHFVVRLIDKDGKRSIFDSWTGLVLPLNHYSFRSYRLFKLK